MDANCKQQSVANNLLTHERLAKAVYKYNKITESSINVLYRRPHCAVVCFFNIYVQHDYRAHKAKKAKFPSSMPQECTSSELALFHVQLAQ